MNLLSPTTVNHTLKIIPRFYTQEDVIMNLWNEEKKTDTDYIIEPVLLDGYMYLSFEQGFINNTNFQVKVTINNDVLYRGKLFITDQLNTTQTYKITKDVFTYE
jgi:hypothetical protein